VRLIEEELFSSDGGTSPTTTTHQLLSKITNKPISVHHQHYPFRTNTSIATDQSSSTTTTTTTTLNKPFVIILMLGGLTYGELAAFRFLAEKKNMNLLLWTTKVVNGNTLLNECRDTL
jgi:hypothetical protein